MLRASTFCVQNAKVLLMHRCNKLDYQVTQVHCSQPNPVFWKDPTGRKPRVQPPPPPPPKPNDDGWFWGTISVLLVTGIGFVTAKSSPEIRDWLSIYLPWVDDIIAIVYEENYTYAEIYEQRVQYFKKYITDYNKPCLPDGPPPALVEVAEIEDSEDEDKNESTCKPRPSLVGTENICDIDKCIKELSELVANIYATGQEACNIYNQLVDDLMRSVCIAPKDMECLREAEEERKDLVKDSLKIANDTINRLENMHRYLDCGVKATKTELDNTKRLYSDLKTKYTAARMKFQWANDVALQKDVQWHIVANKMENYVEETQAMYKGLDYTQSKPRIMGKDADPLLYHTVRYAEELQAELVETAAAMSERVNRAYDELPIDPKNPKARTYMVDSLVAKKNADLEYDLRKRFDDQKKRNDDLLKELMAQQIQQGQETMKIRLEEKEREATKNFNMMVDAQFEGEKILFKEQLKDMAAKLKIVEDTLETRLRAERKTGHSQELWAASASLLHATQKGEPYTCINKELNLIRKISEGTDKLIMTVLRSIPKSVCTKGVVPESVLKEWYIVMENAALKVALVEEDGGVMPVYILSWLQACLLFMKIKGIPQNEFEKPPPDPCEKLDTFDLLQRARFYVERGNFALALRYVNSLKGASRLAAHNWYEAATAHVQVKQAAQALLAHAAAMGLQYI